MITNKQTPTCFLIDDDDDDRDFLVEAFSRINTAFSCLRAKDGAEGVKMLSSGEILPEFILLDLNMPRMSGADCLVSLRKLPHLLSTPIFVYTTAHCTPVAIAKMITAGADNVLMKPIRMDDLISLMKNLLEQVAFRKRIAMQ